MALRINTLRVTAFSCIVLARILSPAGKQPTDRMLSHLPEFLLGSPMRPSVADVGDTGRYECRPRKAWDTPSEDANFDALITSKPRLNASNVSPLG